MHIFEPFILYVIYYIFLNYGTIYFFGFFLKVENVKSDERS
jgi:hypothetical protein